MSLSYSQILNDLQSVFDYFFKYVINNFFYRVLSVPLVEFFLVVFIIIPAFSFFIDFFFDIRDLSINSIESKLNNKNKRNEINTARFIANDFLKKNRSKNITMIDGSKFFHEKNHFINSKKIKKTRLFNKYKDAD